MTQEVLDFDKLKAGVKTTEFWIALVAQLLALMVLLGAISPTDVPALEGDLNASIESVGALTLSLLSVWKYIDSRTKVKVAVESNAVYGAEIEPL